MEVTGDEFGSFADLCMEDGKNRHSTPKVIKQVLEQLNFNGILIFILNDLNFLETVLLLMENEISCYAEMILL